MAGGGAGGSSSVEEYVYRISAAEEWKSLQMDGCTLGGEVDRTTGCIHLSNLNQVQWVLQNFYLSFKDDLYLLKIDSKKLGDGLVYESGDESNVFPHFYGPSRSFSPLPLDAVKQRSWSWKMANSHAPSWLHYKHQIGRIWFHCL